MINAFTVDVEDYWSVFSRDWLHEDMEPTDAVVKNTEWILQTLDDRNVKATFFILGEVAKKFPSLVKSITHNGHEIGVHGFYHKQIFKLSSEEFKKEVGDAQKLIEDISGQKVIGHRAPAFSLNADTQWALKILAECGFKYDSSISPMRGRRYGWPGFRREIHEIKLPNGQSIIEAPMSTVSFGIGQLGVGGGYIRHLPYLYSKWVIKHIQKTRPVILYMHPYEIDTQELDFAANNLDGKQKGKALGFHRMQMRNRHTVKNKIQRLLEEFKFDTLKNLIEKHLCLILQS